MIEIVTANLWLYTKLSGDAQLTAIVSTRIYADVVPDQAVYPLVLFQFRPPGKDLMTLGTTRVFSELSYSVRGVIAAKSYSGLTAVADRIESLLHGASGTTNDGTIFGCVRTSPLALIEQEDAKDGTKIDYRHLGGVYRLFVR